MTDNIIQFGKSQPVEPELDYAAIRDSILGESNILNIEGSIHFVSSDYLDHSVEERNEVCGFIRETLTTILQSGDACKDVHNLLLALDDTHDTIAARTDAAMPYVTSSIDFDLGETVITIHVLLVGWVRFVRSFKVDGQTYRPIPL